ncbi:uncharacterized protein LOC128961350 [Oppia nitens]|uniref:uncharacterized protein LOC128961350 n=1 Tax=Oppia nitens TaxID=1686743 RepID=UPI0023DAD2B3|nr:uncharacterized protein LOC128961350 [Oppia nitens]
MLDNFLGNVFGRSKKSSTNVSATATTTATAATTGTTTHAMANNGNYGSDDFIMVGSGFNDTFGGGVEDPTAARRSLYPTVGGTLLTQEMFVPNNNSFHPSSSSSATTTTPIASGHQSSYISPIDNIPFTTTYGGSCGFESVGGVYDPQNWRSLAKSFATIDRIQQYLSTSSQSEYSFHLENNILSESLLQQP